MVMQGQAMETCKPLHPAGMKSSMSSPPGQGGRKVLVDTRCLHSLEQAAGRLDGLQAGRRVAGVRGAMWPVALLRLGGGKE